jgi:hypothetical protein
MIDMRETNLCLSNLVSFFLTKSAL